MATMSVGVFSTFISIKPTSFLKSSSLTFLVTRPATTLEAANLRMVRSVTSAAAAEPKTPPGSGKREPRGITKPRRISPEMQALVRVPEIPRTQALKLIWAHIKEHNLQDPEDKKVIICDEKLKNIFAGRDRVGFLEIAGLISPHFLK